MSLSTTAECCHKSTRIVPSQRLKQSVLTFAPVDKSTRIIGRLRIIHVISMAGTVFFRFLPIYRSTRIIGRPKYCSSYLSGQSQCFLDRYPAVGIHESMGDQHTLHVTSMASMAFLSVSAHIQEHMKDRASTYYQQCLNGQHNLSQISIHIQKHVDCRATDKPLATSQWLAQSFIRGLSVYRSTCIKYVTNVLCMISQWLAY